MPALSIALILIAFLIAVPATLAARALGRRLNALDGPGVRGQVKAAQRRVPNTGGLAIFLGIALPMLAGLALVRSPAAGRLAEWFPGLSRHLPGITAQTPAAVALLAGLLVLHVVGLIDDRRPLGPYLKLLVMLAVSTGVVMYTDSRLLMLLDRHAGGPWLSIVITVVWIVVVTNAFNFMDNMDGLSAGVAAICGGFFLVAAVVAGQWFIAATLALIVGSCAGFLVFNFPWRGLPPRGRGATIFMGDSGSIVLGFLLAVLSVRITYLPTFQSPDPLASSSSYHLLLTPIIILAIPLYDFCSVVVIRLSQGKSPFVGDLQHFSHRLVQHGLSRRAAVVIIYGCTAVTSIGGIALPRLEPWQAALVGVQTLLVLLVLGLYEWARTP